MFNRIGFILIVSGFLLLYKPEIFSIETIIHILNSNIEYWPILLIIIGFVFIMPRKKRTVKKKDELSSASVIQL